MRPRFGKWHMGGDQAPPRPEFDHWVSFPGQGTYMPVDAFGRTTMLNVNGRQVPQKGYITDELTDYVLDFLEHRDRDRPFFAYLSHKAVHAMFTPAPRHAAQYADAEIRLGDAPPPGADAPIWVRNQRNSWHGEEFPYHSELPLEEFTRQYHRTLSAVDDSIGRLRQWLKQAGLENDTIVVLMGDNGFLLGEHGLIDKRNAYEESMRVPLLVVAPGLFAPGQVVREMVANIDLAPTFLAFAGLAAPAHYDGRSFSGLISRASGDVGRHARPAWRESLVYEYYWEFNYPMTPTTFALRTDQYKYIQYHGVWDTEELYDLRRDPREASNLIEDPALLDVKVAMRRQLFAALADGDGRHSVPFTEKFNQGAVFRHRNRSKAARYPEKWLRDKNADDRWEHVIPDGPDKAERLKVVNDALKDQ
ncbi:MAG: sulfatase-like hydrolase/transferase [Pseudomonadales bacterium]